MADKTMPRRTSIADELAVRRRAADKLARPRCPALDKLLGVPVKVLDDGFVRVVDYMGGDAAIVQAARVSYGTGTKRVQDDRGLIRYLLRHQHTTPFEMCELKLHVRVPMDCWRQWIRHRTANVNEYSTRYSVAIDAAQQTAPTRWRGQTGANRQGSAGSIDRALGRQLSRREIETQRLAREIYDERLKAGVAREQARKDLPLSTYTEAYWKIDLHNLLHFLHLRMDPTAQLEIRSYADVIGRRIVAQWCPLTWEAFNDYRRNALLLSRLDIELIRALESGNRNAAITLARNSGLLPPKGQKITRSRERLEFEGKALLLGFQVPWRTT